MLARSHYSNKHALVDYYCHESIKKFTRRKLLNMMSGKP